MSKLESIEPGMAEIMNATASSLAKIFPGMAFALFVFPPDSPDGRANYISNASRGEMVKVLEEFTTRHKAQPYDGVMPEGTKAGKANG